VTQPAIRKISRRVFLSLAIAILVCLTLTADAAAADTAWTQTRNTASAINTPMPDNISLECHICLPSASTLPATFVEETTATLNGKVIFDGGQPCQYRFVYGTVSGSYTVYTSWTGHLTTCQTFSVDVTGLIKGMKYYFRAQAKNIAGIGSGAELNFLTKPEMPASFTANVVSDTQIDLSWTKGEGAQRTLIIRKTGGFPADRNDGVQVYFDTRTSFSDTGLTPGTAYYYRAWSHVAGSEQWSDGYIEVSATTGSTPPPTTTPPVAVGGVVYPVNKAQVLAPWLTAGLIFTLVAGGYIVRIALMNNKG